MRKTNLILIVVLLVATISFVFAASFSGIASSSQRFGTTTSSSFSGSSGYQYTRPSFNTIYSSEQLQTYWPILRDMENDQCQASNDFLIAIPPAGCTPMVVRSDLLEEQNVPVFCKLDALQINPLIQVSSINSISFQGQYPEGVAGISFHPARAAVRSYNTLLGNPLLNNIGYVVIILKRNSVEKTMPKFVAGNLTATIHYDAEKAFGVGQAEYYLPVMSDDEWSQKYAASGFWYGRGFIRVNDIENGKARVSLYTNENTLFRTFDLNEGDTSGLMYFPGFYCRAGLKVKLNKIVGPEKQASIEVDGEELQVREGTKIINGRCSIRKINALQDGLGSIEISCPGQTISLRIQQSNANIKIGEEEKQAELGKLVLSGKDIKYSFDKNVKADTTDKSLYLGYIGKIPSIVEGVSENNTNKEFVLLVSSDKDLSDSELLSISQKVAIVSEYKKKTGDKTKLDITWFNNELGKALGFTSSKRAYILVKDSGVSNLTVDTKDIKFLGITKVVKQNTVPQVINDYYSKSNETVSKIIESYSAESSNFQAIGEANIWEQIRIAKLIGNQDEQQRLLRLLIDKYPKSVFIEKAKQDFSLISNFDFGKSQASVNVNSEYHFIKLNDIKPTDNNAKSVFLSIGARYETYYEESKILLNNDNANDDYIIIKKIEPNKITFEYHDITINTVSGKIIPDDKLETFYLGVDNSSVKSGKEIFVKEINVNKIAYVSIVPEIKQTTTQSNFTFKIGIEKRAIELTPEKTKEMLKNLNETIKKWEDITEKLGKLITAWKGACFATSAVLMASSLVTGLSGEGLARTEVMKGYRDVCDQNIRDGKYSTRTQCYNALSPEISKDVSAYSNMVKNSNDLIKKYEANHQTGKGLLGEVYVDGDAALKDLKADYGNQEVSIKIPGTSQTGTLKVSDFETWEDFKKYYAVEQLKQQPGVSDATIKTAEQQRDAQLYHTYVNIQDKQRADKFSQDITSRFGGVPKEVKFIQKQGLERTTWSGDTVQGFQGLWTNAADNWPEGMTQNSKIQFLEDGTGQYVLVLNEGDVGKGVGVNKAYSVTDSGAVPVSVEKLKEFQKYSFVATGQCENPYYNARVRFYENSPSSKLPAIVPFDIKRGWYAKVSNTPSTLFSNQQQGYQASGAVSFFYICNVGSNGKEENMKGDDLCQSFDINTYDKVSSFRPCPSLSASQVKDLAERAQEAIRQASQQYGKKKISIFGQSIDVDAPMSEETFECQDFMSPEQCKILFNVCDPVICPPSRCNLGGKYPVANVVQTGIIGSIVLCLPNIREGILIPVCLTGIHAGIESYVSILKSERDCLQKSLETGEHVGICDEITSIYLCEFFWRQLAPLLDIIIPRMIELAYGQNVRGGGEYMTVMHSWDNLQNNIDYFKNTYAQNAFRAFQIKNVQEAGGEFCRAFIGTSLPTSASALNSLLEPESPPQFYAWFSEITFTEATVPATSQYKIYYHIFAGNDAGKQYAVYLKNPPSSSYYSQTQEILIKTGYIAKGEQADESIDFTAPAGYKELCVVIDAQIYCGFKQVSSDFGLQYLQKKYTEEQANTQNIKTEKECISGTPSVIPLVNPNLQAGIEGVITPQANLMGIVRICASLNPGASVYGNNANSSRWKDVGHCDNTNIRCWLDLNSVKDDLQALNNINAGLSGTQGNLSLLDAKNIMTEEQSMSEISDIKKEINENLRKRIEKEITGLLLTETSTIEFNVNSLIGDINTDKSLIYRLAQIQDRGNLNYHKAEALSLEADIYRLIVEVLAVKLPVYVQSKEDAKAAVVNPATTIVGALCGNGAIDSGEDCEVEADCYTASLDVKYSCDKCQCIELNVEPATPAESVSASSYVGSLTISGKPFYFKFGTIGLLDYFSGEKWLYSQDNKKTWNSIRTAETNYVGFLSGKTFEEGVNEINKRKK